jgi:anti-sigma factor RsiW
MSCQAARQLIQDSLDDTLPRAAQDELQSHLAGCESCAQDHTSLLAAVSVLEALPRVTAPPELLSRLSPELDALASQRPPRRKRVWAWVPGGAIAAGLLIALSVMQFQPAAGPVAEQMAMEPPSSEEILEWVDASAEPGDLFASDLFAF